MKTIMLRGNGYYLFEPCAFITNTILRSATTAIGPLVHHRAIPITPYPTAALRRAVYRSRFTFLISGEGRTTSGVLSMHREVWRARCVEAAGRHGSTARDAVTRPVTVSTPDDGIELFEPLPPVAVECIRSMANMQISCIRFTWQTFRQVRATALVPFKFWI